MASLFDAMMSTIIFGILALAVARVQGNINVSMYQNQYNVVTQTNAVELARQIEWDFAKIGYHVSGQKILQGDSTDIRFRSDLTNTSVVNVVEYLTGDTSQARGSSNPNDFPLFRKVGSETIRQDWGLTYFRITYYDADYHEISTPITAPDQCARICAVNVEFRIESQEPVATEYDTTWAAVTWEKTIVPRNLNNLDY